MTINKILCPVDFSEFSRHAVEYAIGIARWYGASLTALNVLPPITSSIPPTGEGLYPAFVFSPDDLRQFRTELDAFVRGAGEVDVPIEAMVLEGSLAGEITRVATELPADLIVMGTHGRSGFERLVLGSVTEKMLRKAPCPLLTVPRRAPELVPVTLFRRILCATDFSPSAAKALALAESFAKETDAQLTILHVLEEVPLLEPVLMGAAGGPQTDAERRAAARQRLGDAISSEARTFSHVSEIVMPGAKPYREILRLADEQRSDLIVLGAHGGRTAALAFGSTPNHVVREAACPVLTVRG